MGVEPFILPIVIIGAVSGAISLLANITGAFIYDFREVARLRELKRLPNARANRQRPRITIAVSAHNNEETIVRCLESIFRNNYRHADVIVVDHASTDWTAPLVRTHIAAHPKRRIKLVARRSKQGSAAAIIKAFKRHGRGQLVVTLPASCSLDKTALLTIVRCFAVEPDWDVIKPNKQPAVGYSATGLFAVYSVLLNRRNEKLQSISGSCSNPGQLACYRSKAFKNQSVPFRVGYAHDVIAYTPAASLRRPFAKYEKETRIGRKNERKKFGLLETAATTNQIIALITWPIIATYFLYLALVLHEPKMLLVLLGMLSALLLFSIWEDGRLRTLNKILLAAGIPFTFGLFYITSIVRPLRAITVAPVLATGYIRHLRRAG